MEKTQPKGKAMQWKEAVISAITRRCRARKNDIFTRQELLKYELDQIVVDTSSKGATPDQTLSRVLQELRDAGEIEFIDNEGTYRKL